MEERLRALATFLDTTADPRELRDGNDLMNSGVEAMNHVLFLTASIVAIDPARGGYAKRYAPMLGLAVRCFKLYEGLLQAIVDDRREHADVFLRPLIEACINLEYLLANSADSSKSFINGSFRPEREMLADLNAVRAGRALSPIEQRIRAGIAREIRAAGLTQTQVLETRVHGIDGKSIRQIMAETHPDLVYPYLYGSLSHAVHGTWRDLTRNHIERRGRNYVPTLVYNSVSPEIFVAPNVLLLEQLRTFAVHFLGDESGFFERAASDFCSYFENLDAAVEAWLISDPVGI